jgi:hypothetical protein
MRVYSELPYEAFIAGRRVANALHYEDGTPGCIGEVAEMRRGDMLVSDEEWDAYKAAILAANDALPDPEVPPAPPTLAEQVEALKARLDAADTERLTLDTRLKAVEARTSAPQQVVR